MATQIDVQNARNKADASARLASEYSSGANTVSQVLKDRLNEAYDYNADIVKPLDEATASYLTAPSAGREKYQDIFNPFQREKLVSQYTSNKSLPMLTLSNLLGTRQGTIADTITAGTGAYNAQAKSATDAAALDRQAYQDLATELQQEFENNIKLQQLELDRQKSNNSEGLSISDILAIAKYGQPSDAQREAANLAGVAKESIATIKNILESDPEALKFAGNTGALSMLGRLRTGGNDDILRSNLTYVQSAFQKLQSGAALSDSERKFYGTFIVDPIQAISGTESTTEALNIIGSILDKIEKQGTDPNASLISSFLNPDALGGGELDSIYGY